MPAASDFQRQMERNMTEWSAEVEKLRAGANERMTGARAGARAHFDQQVEHLEADRRALQEKLAALGTAAEERQARARADVEKAAAKFKRDLDDALDPPRSRPGSARPR